MLATGILLFIMFSGRFSRARLLRRFRPLRNSLESVALWTNRRPRVLIAALLAGASWLSLGAGAWLVAEALGIALPFWKIAVLLVVMKTFTSFVPSGPGSLGAFEFSGVYALGLFTVDASLALTFVLIVHALIFLPHLAVGVPVLARERRTVQGAMQSVGRLLPRGRGLVDGKVPQLAPET